MSRKDTLLAREKQRAQAEADQQQSFTVRNYSLYVVGILIMLLGGVISALTEGWHLDNKFGSLGLAIFGVGVIEFVSIYFGGGVVNDIRNGIFSADGISKSIFMIKVLLYVGATYFSVSLTLDGAPDFYAVQKESKAPPTLVSEDSIKAEYKAQADSMRVSLRKLEATTWKGKIVTDVRPTIALINKQLVELSNQEAAAIEDAKLENQVIQQDWDDDLAEDQKIVLGFAGLGEILKIASIILIALFKEGRDDELGIHKLERMTGKDIDGDGIIGDPKDVRKPPGYYHRPAAATPTSGTEDLTPTPRRPIGFFTSPAPSATEHDTSSPDVSQWPPVATDTDYKNMESSVLQLAYKEARSSMKKWEAKLNNGQGTTATNQKNIAKWQRHMEAIESRLREIQ